MKKRKAYRSTEWDQYVNRVLSRDKHQCLKCDRNKNEVTLQVHHTNYQPNKAPWEYPLSTCITLCKGCHAREHDLIPPNEGWTLLGIDDLGALSGKCERKSGSGICGNDIRYEHTIYYPNWGYLIVGSTCVDFLTDKDKYISAQSLKAFRDVNKAYFETIWRFIKPKFDEEHLGCSYKRYRARIYQGDNNEFYLQFAKRIKGEYEYGKYYYAHSKDLDDIKELAIIALVGKTSRSKVKIEALREIYRDLKKSSGLLAINSQ